MKERRRPDVQAHTALRRLHADEPRLLGRKLMESFDQIKEQFLQASKALLLRGQVH